MRLLRASSRPLNRVRPPLAVARHVQRRSLRTPTYDAAVVGGGITGLTAAYRLSRDPKCSKVTLYDKSKHLGGWMQSEKIPFKDGHVVFEYGPRTLRTALPACLPLLDLLTDLNLVDDILLTSKSTPAALNRYIYYPDHLVRMPAPLPWRSHMANLWSILSTLIREPVFKSIFRGVHKDLTAPAPKPPNADESIADFVSRRFTPELADNLVSALAHGIWAGDINRLSTDALFPLLRPTERIADTVGPSVLMRWIHDAKEKETQVFVDDFMAMDVIDREKDLGSIAEVLEGLVKGASVLTLRNGLGQLSDALLAALTTSKKVELMPETEVKAISRNQSSSNITIVPEGGERRLHNRVISTIPAPHLARALRQTSGENARLPQNTIRELERHNYAVTVMVVNLFYENPDLLSAKGFGYLIPRSIPFEQNPERALGVIFGSETGIGQDTVPGTKLTVMMGGHLWDGWTESDYPDHDTAVKMARSLLNRHLGITDAPSISRSCLRRDAIPQYTVGHVSRMDKLSDSVREDFNRRLTLAGSWYGGVGVVDCIRQGYLAASYGVGAQKLMPSTTGPKMPWELYNFTDWETEGGIVTSPVRAVRQGMRRG